MPKIRVSVLSFLCLVTCSPGFTADGTAPNPPLGDMRGEVTGGTTVDVKLTQGSFQSTNVGATYDFQINGTASVCPMEISEQAFFEAMNPSKCELGTGFQVATCTYKISPETLAKPAIQSARNFFLKYSEDKRLPFYAQGAQGTFDAIQSWAAITVKYSSGEPDTFISTETELINRTTTRSEDRQFQLRQAVDGNTTINFTTFVNCSNVRLLTNILVTTGFRNPGCTGGVPSAACGDRKFAESNNALSSMGTFSWKVSNLKLVATP